MKWKQTAIDIGLGDYFQEKEKAPVHVKHEPF